MISFILLFHYFVDHGLVVYIYSGHYNFQQTLADSQYVTVASLIDMLEKWFALRGMGTGTFCCWFFFSFSFYLDEKQMH